MPSSSYLPRRAVTTLALALSVSLASLAQAEDTASITAPSVAAIARSKSLGKTSVSQKISLFVGLKMSNLAGLERFASAVNDPKSSSYHHFLTPGEIGDRFGSSATDANKVVTYLKKYFTNVRLAKSRTSVLVDGTVSQANSAFGVALGNFQALRADERIGSLNFYANTTAPKIPKSIASLVSIVGGLENFHRRKPHTAFLTPGQTRTLYNVNALDNAISGTSYRGEGVTVGISNFSGFRLSNLNQFYGFYGLPAPVGGVGSNVSVVKVAGGTGATDPIDPNGSEGDLDIQLALAMAPRCNLVIYDAPNSVANGVILFQQEQDDNVLDIVSESYGSPVGTGLFSFVVEAHKIHAAMSAQGMTYLASSGDTGTYPTIESEQSDAGNVIDPDILIVGGTVATVNATGNRLAEDGWVGSGGGYTAYRANGLDFNKRPSWQMNIGIPNDPAHDYRLYPDVALHAAGSNDPNSNDYYTAYSYVFNGAFAGVSGTSASCPIFAGQLALILQKLKLNNAADAYLDADGVTIHYRLGHLQEALYGIAANPTTSGAFFDITTGPSNGSLPDGTSSVPTSGFDFVTGLGAPVVDQLYTGLFGFSSDPVLVSPDSATPYTTLSPALVLGTNPSGDASALTATDGSTYSLQTVTQGGVGQVAAVKMSYALTSTNHRGATFTVAVSSPALTTGFVYLQNQAGVYVPVATLAGNGTMKSVSVNVDLAAYVKSDNTVAALVRVERPTRLGSAPYRLTIDRATITELVPRSG